MTITRVRTRLQQALVGTTRAIAGKARHTSSKPTASRDDIGHVNTSTRSHPYGLVCYIGTM
eukprot:4358913-Prymnesium_polylepis.1